MTRHIYAATHRGFIAFDRSAFQVEIAPVGYIYGAALVGSAAHDLAGLAGICAVF